MLDNTQFWDELAIQSYKSILKTNANNPLVHKNLGLAYARTGKLNKAARSLQRAVKADKNYLEAYYHLGTIYEKMGKKVEAIRAFSNYHKRASLIKKGSPVVGDILEKLKDAS